MQCCQGFPEFAEGMAKRQDGAKNTRNRPILVSHAACWIPFLTPLPEIFCVRKMSNSSTLLRHLPLKGTSSFGESNAKMVRKHTKSGRFRHHEGSLIPTLQPFSRRLCSPKACTMRDFWRHCELLVWVTGSQFRLEETRYRTKWPKIGSFRPILVSQAAHWASLLKTLLESCFARKKVNLGSLLEAH